VLNNVLLVNQAPFEETLKAVLAPHDAHCVLKVLRPKHMRTRESPLMRAKMLGARANENIKSALASSVEPAIGVGAGTAGREHVYEGVK
jgi:hypothetical protein